MSLVFILLFLQADLERAQTLLRQGKITEAQRAIESVLKDTPDSVPALTLQGRIAMAESNFDLARKSFTRAASLALGGERLGAGLKLMT